MTNQDILENQADRIYLGIGSNKGDKKKNIELNKFMKKYNNFIKDNINLSDLAKLNKKSMMLMDIAGWQ